MLRGLGVLIGEFHPLPGKAYSCEQLEIRYLNRTVQFQWGFMSWTWLEECLKAIGFHSIEKIPSRGGMALIFVARR